MEKINRDPNGWVQSLKTFDKYGFFIECDIEAPVELHDKFNDLPFLPVQKAGMYSDGIKKYAAKNDIVDKVKETNTPKLICDIVPRQKYLVHYSLLQLGIQQGYRVTHIHHLIRFKQALFIFEYVNMLGEKRAKILDNCGEEPVQAVGKLDLWQIRGDWVETNESEVRQHME